MSFQKKINKSIAAIKRLFDRNKKSNFFYYLSNFTSLLIPDQYFRSRLNNVLASVDQYDKAYIKSRVNYYNKLTGKSQLAPGVKDLSSFKLVKKMKTYFFDSYQYSRYFNPALKVDFLFGDIIHVPDTPAIVKSRPVLTGNANSVLLKLNKQRHFLFVNDTKAFLSKKDMLVWRGKVYQDHRRQFMKLYLDHPLCNIGQVNTEDNPHWQKGRLTTTEQLEYKFILCLEGNDVASNLKWVMSSGSIAVMPKPKYETWFMEGALTPDFHYILIKDDYSDLEERLNYYIKNTNEALQIIKNANAHVQQFKDEKMESLISLLVLQKYFYRTGQIKMNNASLFES